jgi:hypothetical protein
VALLNDVERPLTLVQLGIAAPALITSYINGSTISAKPLVRPTALAIISDAHASDLSGMPNLVLAGGFLSDVSQGLTQSLGSVGGQADNGNYTIKNNKTGDSFVVAPSTQDKTSPSHIEKNFPSPSYKIEKSR